MRGNVNFWRWVLAPESLAATLAVSSGVALGLCLANFQSFDFKCELSIGDVLSILVTIFLTFVVSSVWRDQQSRQDKTLDALMYLIGEAKLEARGLQEKTISLLGNWSEGKFDEIKTGFRNLNNTAYHLDTLLDHSSESRKRKKDDIVRPLRSAILSLKQAITEGDPKVISRFSPSFIHQKFSAFNRVLAQSQVKLLAG